MFNFKRSGYTDSEPSTMRVRLANSTAVQKGMVIGLNATGFGIVKALITDKCLGVIEDIQIQNVSGARPPRSSQLTNGVYTAPSNNQSSTADIAFVTVIIDPMARYTADWDVTPTSNSLITGAGTDVNVTGLTLANANSLAPGSSANMWILSTDVTNLKSEVKFNTAEMYVS